MRATFILFGKITNNCIGSDQIRSIVIDCELIDNINNNKKVKTKTATKKQQRFDVELHAYLVYKYKYKVQWQTNPWLFVSNKDMWNRAKLGRLRIPFSLTTIWKPKLKWCGHPRSSTSYIGFVCLSPFYGLIRLHLLHHCVVLTHTHTISLHFNPLAAFPFPSSRCFISHYPVYIVFTHLDQSMKGILRLVL